MTQTMDRRRFLAAGSAFTALGLTAGVRQLLAAPSKPGFRIGACDWSIGYRQDIQALEEAKRIGLEGVQVSFSEPGGDFDLRNETIRSQYLAASRRLNVQIASLAMGIFNQKPFATDEHAERWLTDCIQVMEKMGQKIVLLAFFGKGDIKGKPDLQREVIRRLKRVAPRAEKAGVILGVESTLDVHDHLRLLDGVASPNVQVYYDVANMHYAGYDIYAEMKKLGRERICQIHAKERGHLLGQGPIDFRRVREVLDEIGYRDWLIIEGATVRGRSRFDCYVDNLKYLRRLFPSSL